MDHIPVWGERPRLQSSQHLDEDEQDDKADQGAQVESDWTDARLGDQPAKES